MAETKSRMTAVLVAVIVLLALVLLYALVIRPAASGYAVNLQNQGAADEDVRILNGIVTQLQQTGGAVQIPVGNQTLTLYAQQIIPQLCAQLNNGTK